MFFYVGQTIVKARFAFILAFRELIVDSDVFKLNIFLVSDLFQKLFLEHFLAELNFGFGQFSTFGDELVLEELNLPLALCVGAGAFIGQGELLLDFGDVLFQEGVLLLQSLDASFEFLRLKLLKILELIFILLHFIDFFYQFALKFF